MTLISTEQEIDQLRRENARLLRALHAEHGSCGEGGVHDTAIATRPTREQILSEPAGPRLNRWVAQYVMGCYERKYLGKFGHHLYDLVIPGDVSRIAYMSSEGCWLDCPKYSEDISEAWAVMDRIGARHGWAIIHTTHSKHGTGWFVVDNGEYDFVTLSGAACETAPLAICRAALLLLIRTLT